jgi:hypothetical protein
MRFIPRSTFRPLGPRSLALAAAALAVAVSPAGAAHHANTPPAGKHHGEQRLVVRGDATAVDGPCDDTGVCSVKLAEGRFRGTPFGPGGYTGSIKLNVGRGFPNGEGGACAPLKGRIVLGAGTPDRLVLTVAGDSCQDGAGPLTAASFSGLAQFTVTHASGSYAGASGAGLASFSEDAANHHRMTLIGRVWGAS